MQNFLAAVQALIDINQPINASLKSQYEMLLLQAVAFRNTNIVNLLLTLSVEQAEIKAQVLHQALVVAVEIVDVNMVILLSDAGAKASHNYQLAIKALAEVGNVMLLQILLHYDPEINLHAEAEYLLRHACLHGKIDIVDYMLSHTDATDIEAEFGAALANAAYAGHLPTVQLLIAHGADVNACQSLAFRHAAAMGHVTILEYLAEAGANIHACHDAALKLAIEGDHTAAVTYLRGMGCR